MIPQVIQTKIFSYLYINPDLEDDIAQFPIMKEKISNSYKNIFGRQWFDWLFNDLYRFQNDFQPTMYGYVENFINIWKRLPFFNGDLIAYHNKTNINDNNVMNRINLMLAIMTPAERSNFYEIFCYNRLHLENDLRT